MDEKPRDDGPRGKRRKSVGSCIVVGMIIGMGIGIPIGILHHWMIGIAVGLSCGIPFSVTFVRAGGWG